MNVRTPSFNCCGFEWPELGWNTNQSGVFQPRASLCARQQWHFSVRPGNAMPQIKKHLHRNPAFPQIQSNFIWFSERSDGIMKNNPQLKTFFFFFPHPRQLSKQLLSQTWLLLQNPARDGLIYTAHKYLRILDYAHGSCSPTAQHSSCSRQAFSQRTQRRVSHWHGKRWPFCTDIRAVFFLSALQLKWTRPSCHPITSHSSQPHRVWHHWRLGGVSARFSHACSQPEGCLSETKACFFTR